ncbi:MAG TPA: SDR family NAD(P)-dependent oxidoreductase [Dehalococcoidia bacterium]|nr:SDR family NAD(P)-dependent oxidoreductase [Dehalococcoidia bacterium]
MGLLDNKTVLLTGGGSGIGRAVVEKFISEGARMAVLERVPERAEELKKQFGEVLLPVVGDVREMADNERAVAETVKAFGKLDVFVGNAGVFDGFQKIVDIDKNALTQACEELFAVNVVGYILGAKAAIPELEKTQGRMVFTASQAGFNPGGGGVIYTASKHAVVGMIRQLALELRPNIQVNGVAPGGVYTDLRGISTLGLGKESNFAHVPPGILQEPSDQAGAYLFLAAKELSPVTNGTCIDTMFMPNAPDNGVTNRRAE